MRKATWRGRIADDLAVTLDGTLLVNALGFDGVESVEEALQVAVRAGMACFVGVALEPPEARKVVARLREATHEAAASVLGARQKYAKLRKSAGR